MSRTFRVLKLLAGALAVLVGVLGAAVAYADSGFQPFFAQGPFVISLGKDIKAAGTSGRFVVPERHVFGVLGGSPTSTTGLPFVPFVIEFGTNVPITTQSGNVHGILSICEAAGPTPIPPLFWCLDPATLSFDSDLAFVVSLDSASYLPDVVTRTARVALTTSLEATPVPCLSATDPFVACTADGFSKGLKVSGVFTFTGATARGHGDVDGFLVLELASTDANGMPVAPCSDLGPDCHIVGIATDPASGFPASLLTFTGQWKP